jgi:thiol-disulfide isomerase/thioredoxin
MSNKITNVVLVVVCVLLVGLVVRREFSRPAPAHQWNVGQDFKTASMTMPNDVQCGKPTLVMAVSSSCHFCQEDVPIYQKIRSSLKVRDGIIQTAFMMPNTKPEADKWVADNKLTGPYMASQRIFTKAGFTATPTILLIGKDNKVVRFWVGALSPKDEKDLMALLNADQQVTGL